MKLLAVALATRTFCQFWATGDQMDKFDFFISRAPMVKEELMKKNPTQEKVIDRAIQCYIENTSKIVEDVDTICVDEVKDGNDRTEVVMQSITSYINGCIHTAQDEDGV